MNSTVYLFKMQAVKCYYKIFGTESRKNMKI